MIVKVLKTKAGVAGSRIVTVLKNMLETSQGTTVSEVLNGNSSYSADYPSAALFPANKLYPYDG